MLIVAALIQYPQQNNSRPPRRPKWSKTPAAEEHLPPAISSNAGYMTHMRDLGLSRLSRPTLHLVKWMPSLQPKSSGYITSTKRRDSLSQQRPAV